MNSSIKGFSPFKKDSIGKFEVFEANIDNNKRTLRQNKVSIESLQPSIFHRLIPRSSNQNVRRLVNRMKEYNKLVERSIKAHNMTAGRKKIKRNATKKKGIKYLSTRRNKKHKIKNTYKKY
jgi:hypothetical protein